MAYNPFNPPFNPTLGYQQQTGGFTSPYNMAQGNSYQMGAGMLGDVSFNMPSGSPAAPAAPSAPGAGAKSGVGGNLLKTATGLATGNYLQAGLGLVQTIGGIAGANKLNKTPYPEFKPSAEMMADKARTSQFSQMGYTPEQRGQFMSQMGMSQNADYRNAVNMAGGGLSQALNAQRGGMRLGAINQFAQGDAAQRMANIRLDMAQTDKLQNLRNQNTQVALQRRQQLEQAYGGAIKSGTENFVNAFPGGGAGASSYGLGSAMSMLSKMG